MHSRHSLLTITYTWSVLKCCKTSKVSHHACSAYIHSTKSGDPAEVEQSKHRRTEAANVVSPLMGALKPQSSGPLYSNTVTGTLAVDGWAVTNWYSDEGTGRGCSPPRLLNRCIKCNSPHVNGQWTHNNHHRHHVHRIYNGPLFCGLMCRLKG